MGLSKESIIECLRESYGESVTSAEIKAYCQMNDFNYQTITNKLTEYKDNWREIAKASEKDPKVMDILENGPRSLTQAWLLQAMRYKYGRSDK